LLRSGRNRIDGHRKVKKGIITEYGKCSLTVGGACNLVAAGFEQAIG
jgi:hypothetical protein